MSENILILKRREIFCASHRLFNPNWSEEENKKIFGKCAHVNGHGHNYKMEVGVTGKINKETGMLFNLQHLKEILNKEILEYVDHKHLNFDVPWLIGKIPTTEVLVESIWDILDTKFRELNQGVQLQTISIWETEKNIVTKIRKIE